MVEKYQKENKEEYQTFLEALRWRKADLKDKNFGEVTNEIRAAISLPEKLANMLMYVLNGTNDLQFGEPKGEMKWFIKKYPQYKLPNKY